MKEQVLQAKVIKKLQTEGAYVVKTISTNHAGVPDLLVCLRGQFLGLEIKAGTEPTRLQEYNIEQINKAGGIATIVRSVEDVEKIIKALR